MKYVALITLGCFCVLASYSAGRYAPYKPHAGAVTQPVVLWRLTPGEALKRKQAAAYAMVYEITPDNMESYKGWWK